MSDGTFIGRQQPEVTKVSRESEVWTPTIMAAVGATAVDIIIFGAWLAWMVGLFWKRGWSPAWAWAYKWWGLWVIALLFSWGVYPGALAISFLLQTIDKHSPSPRKQREADEPIMSAWGHYKVRPVEGELDEMEHAVPRRVRVEVKENEHTTTIGELPDTIDMHVFARALLRGKSFSQKTSDMSRAKWVAIRDIFLARKWAKWKNRKVHALGLELTKSGRTALLAFDDV